jgi:hypothetical protein
MKSLFYCLLTLLLTGCSTVIKTGGSICCTTIGATGKVATVTVSTSGKVLTSGMHGEKESERPPAKADIE